MTTKTVRKPRTVKPKILTPAQKMLEAVNFILPAQKRTGPLEKRHCVVVDGWVVAFTRDLTIGHPIEGMVNCAPDTFKLKAALMDCGEDLSVVEVSEENVAVTSGDFKAFIPCTSADKITYQNLDPFQQSLNDDVKVAIKNVVAATDGKSANPIANGVIFLANSCVGTDTKIILEGWHGLGLSGQFCISKATAEFIAKSKVPLTGFGASDESVTFYFENSAFIKSNLVRTEIREFDSILDSSGGQELKIPDNFFEGVKSITFFSKDGFIYFKDGRICADRTDNEVSTFYLEGMPTGIAIALAQLKKAKPFFCNVKLHERKLTFNEGAVRGAMTISITKEIEEEFSEGAE